MNFKKPWLANGSFYYEKILIYSAIFIFLVLIFDWFAEVLPIDGYGLIIISLFLTCSSIWSMLYLIQWILKQKKPILDSSLFSQSTIQDHFIFDWLFNLFKKNESIIFYKYFQTANIFKNFNHPTSVIEEVRLLIVEIQKLYVISWYSSVSQNPLFLTDLHILLDEIGYKITEKLKKVDVKELIIILLTIYLQHLQEYKKALRKMKKKQIKDDVTLKFEIENFYKFNHFGNNDELYQFYLEKVSKHILIEYSPHEFTNSIIFKIISNIISRKVLGGFVSKFEDENWINLILLYLFDKKQYYQLLDGKVYSFYECFTHFSSLDSKYKPKSLLLNRKISHNIFSNVSNKLKNKFDEEKFDRQNLSLPIKEEKQENNISHVLGGLISSTAGPLLPDNMLLQYQPLNKMWESPVTDTRKDITFNNTKMFSRKIVEGIKVEDVKPREIKERKALVRSKSSDIMSILDDNLLTRDISIGEELSENINLETSRELIVDIPKHSNKKLVKTRSFDSTTLGDDELDKELFIEDNISELVNNIGDVSPVYEEAEDLSTSIAKLRSLLEQRESSSTLSDKSTHSIDSQSVVSKDSLDQQLSCDKTTDQMNHSLENVCDIPNDGRLFMNIHIPNTELQSEPGSSPYILYTIKYDGVYLAKDQESADEQSHLVLQTTSVKRRFQEFINLQTRLEDNNNLKSALKGVKGPSKWMNLSFSGKTDENTTASRRPVLEAFLQQLSSRIEISTSHEFQEFLGYGTDSANSYIKKDSTFSVQRIDKFLANKVSGVFNSIKTALPTFDFDQTPGNTDTLKSLHDQNLLQSFIGFGNKIDAKELKMDFVVRDKISDNLRSNIRQYFAQRFDCIEDALEALDGNIDSYDFGECHPVNKAGVCIWAWYKEIKLHADDDTEDLDSWVPHTFLILNIICELLQGSRSWLCKEQTVHALKVLFGHWEQRVQHELAKLNWDRIIGNILRILREAMFGEGQKDLKELNIKDLDLAGRLKQAILSNIPDVVLQVISRDVINEGVDTFVSSLQHRKLNRDVLLRVMDVVFVRLLSCVHSSS